MGMTEGSEPEDLTLAVEERFGISFDNDDLSVIKTPGDLTELILTKVELVPSDVCLSQRAFHLIRRAAMRSFGLPRETCKPEARLESIIPRKFRYATWRKFSTNLAASRWPSLKRSRVLVAILVALTGVVFFWSYRSLPMSGLFRFSLATGLTVGFGFLAELLTRPLKRNFPLSCETIGDLAKWIVSENPQLISHDPKGWTRERVSAALRPLIVEWSDVRDFSDTSLFYPTKMIT
jgi:hypothetical protein